MILDPVEALLLRILLGQELQAFPHLEQDFVIQRAYVPTYIVVHNNTCIYRDILVDGNCHFVQSEREAYCAKFDLCVITERISRVVTVIRAAFITSILVLKNTDQSIFSLLELGDDVLLVGIFF